MDRVECAVTTNREQQVYSIERIAEIERAWGNATSCP